MLYVPNQTSTYFTYDNWGANPGSIGTVVNGGTSNALGSWTQIASGSDIAQDVYGLYFQAHSGSASASNRSMLLDIGVDPAGGTSYTAIVSNFAISSSPTVSQAGNREHYIPFFITAGSSVAVRVRCADTAANTVRIAARFYGFRGMPEMQKVGTFTETLGADTANSKGTSITPGTAADGSWLDLGAITNNMWYWQLGYGIASTVITAEYTYFELAYGDASNKTTIFKVMHIGLTVESCGLVAQTQLLPIAAYCPVKAGEHIYVRARTNNTPDTGYNVTVLGIGG